MPCNTRIYGEVDEKNWFALRGIPSYTKPTTFSSPAKMFLGTAIAWANRYENKLRTKDSFARSELWKYDSELGQWFKIG